MGASTDHAPAMLMDVPAEYRRTANPVMLKMFFVEDTDNVTEQCPHDSERVESVANSTAPFKKENTTIAVSAQSPDTFLGMEFDLVSEAPVGHTLAFEIPSGTEIVWVSREEMVDVLKTQEMPASLERRLEAQSRKASLAKGMDVALTQKSDRRCRRRRAPSCTGEEIMAGGAAAMVVGFLVCAFTFIGCFTAWPFLVTMGGIVVRNGACSCWANDNSGRASCAFRRGRRGLRVCCSGLQFLLQLQLAGWLATMWCMDASLAKPGGCPHRSSAQDGPGRAHRPVQGGGACT
ncbi:unnamed protein product [Prorocentrum cordatum]|uniref:Vesicle transport protein n=1 Tax=Prorocentrum cordatum TaxID=2364126 RepID=A0ABN9R1T9_9DINO|nr:unnamed protein product [Polarella glacialis]